MYFIYILLVADLSNLPPLFIHVGDSEMLYGDSVMLYSQAKASGLDVTLKVWNKMPHVFLAFPVCEEGDSAKQAVEGLIQWIHSKLTQSNNRRIIDVEVDKCVQWEQDQNKALLQVGGVSDNC